MYQWSQRKVSMWLAIGLTRRSLDLRLTDRFRLPLDVYLYKFSRLTHLNDSFPLETGTQGRNTEWTSKYKDNDKK